MLAVVFTRTGFRACRDPECLTFARLCHECLLFLTIKHAISHGDAGMLERLIFGLPALFFGAGQGKYGLEMLHLCWLLEALSPPLKDAILSASLVSQKNTRGLWKPIDLAVEHLNLEVALDMRNRRNSTHDIAAAFRRVTSGTVYNAQLQKRLESFFSYHTNRSHTRKDVRQDLLSLLFFLQKEWPCWCDEAQEKRCFEAPDILLNGLRACREKVQQWNDTVRQGKAVGGAVDDANAVELAGVGVAELTEMIAECREQDVPYKMLTDSR
ncbi:hypothetical protein KEM52_003017 [Ascosphaera acerosa]|nr:hypothetical protein KEM52_003017 [Ascosphaera acerosa]